MGGDLLVYLPARMKFIACSVMPYDFIGAILISFVAMQVKRSNAEY